MTLHKQELTSRSSIFKREFSNILYITCLNSGRPLNQLFQPQEMSSEQHPAPPPETQVIQYLQNRIQAISSQISAHKSSTDSFIQQRKILDEKIDSDRAQAEKLRTERENLREELARCRVKDANVRIGELEKELQDNAGMRAEFQSTKEELHATREKLQSTQGELQTIKNELGARNERIRQANEGVTLLVQHATKLQHKYRHQSDEAPQLNQHQPSITGDTVENQGLVEFGYRPSSTSRNNLGVGLFSQFQINREAVPTSSSKPSPNLPKQAMPKSTGTVSKFFPAARTTAPKPRQKRVTSLEKLRRRSSSEHGGRDSFRPSRDS